MQPDLRLVTSQNLSNFHIGSSKFTYYYIAHGLQRKEFQFGCFSSYSPIPIATEKEYSYIVLIINKNSVRMNKFFLPTHVNITCYISLRGKPFCTRCENNFL
jgi:hypothetical protein